MSELLTLDNGVAWLAQTTILIGVAALLPLLIRVRSARWHVRYLQLLLVLTCINQSKGAWVSSGEQLPWSIRTALPCRCRP